MENPSPETAHEVERRPLHQRRLRTMLIATALLLIPQLGEFLAVRDINVHGHVTDLPFLFQFAGIFFIPTSLILTIAIVWTVRRDWRKHERLMLLAAINTLIALNLIIFLVDSCTWSHIFGLTLRGCH